MTNEVDFESLVDRVIAGTVAAGLPLLPVPLTQAFALVLTQKMCDADRLKLTVEIAVIVNSPVDLYRKARQSCQIC